VDIVAATRSAPGIYLGASPRGSIALFRTAQALAFIRGRSYVIPDDVKELVPSTLSHRMMLTSEARLSGLTIDRVLRDILYKIPVPVLPEEGRKPR
jgi:MoxR-like ATPase